MFSFLSGWGKKYVAVSIFVHLVVTVFLYHLFGERLPFFENYDALDYLSLAENISRGNGFMLEGVASALRTPLLPLLLVPIYKFHLPLAWMVAGVQSLFAIFSGCLLYRLGRNFFSPLVGMIAAVLYLIEPQILLASNLALTEILFNFFIIIAVYCFIAFLLASCFDYFWLIISAFAVGGAVLTRPIAWYFPLIFLLVFFIQVIYRRLTVGRAVKAGIIILVAFGLVVSPWLIRQYMVFGRAKVSNIDAWMLYNRTAPIPLSKEKQISYEAAAQMLDHELRFRAKDGGPQDVSQTFRFYDFMKGRAIDLIKNNPLPVVRYYLISAIPTMFGTGYDNLLEEVFGEKRPAERVSYTELLLNQHFSGLKTIVFQLDIFQIFLLGGMTMWVCIYAIVIYGLLNHPDRRKNGLVLFFLISTIGYFVIFTLGPASQVRYRLPTFPFWFLLLGYGVEAVILCKRSGKSKLLN